MRRIRIQTPYNLKELMNQVLNYFVSKQFSNLFSYDPLFSSSSSHFFGFHYLLLDHVDMIVVT